MKGFTDKVAVVTGAGSGIGRALAIELGRSGAKLAISDVDTDGLAATEERLTAIGASVKTDRLDVTEREAFALYADAVKDHYGTVNQIYNNAGISFMGSIEATQFKDIERVMDVDYWGVVNGTKVFLPHLIASGDGHVVNVSSVFGLLAVPGQGAYNAAKFAVRGFTEALRQEMLVAGHPVKVTCVHPAASKPPSPATPPRPTVSTRRNSRTSSTSGWPVRHRRRPPASSSTPFAGTSPAFWSAATPRRSTSSPGWPGRATNGWSPQ
jgi:NADP-dependent 3-hydroxy acid dehydrogenase YdfG